MPPHPVFHFPPVSPSSEGPVYAGRGFWVLLRIPPAHEWWLARGRHRRTCWMSKYALYPLNSKIKRSHHRVLGELREKWLDRPATYESRAVTRSSGSVRSQGHNTGSRSYARSYCGYWATFQCPGFVPSDRQLPEGKTNPSLEHNTRGFEGPMG